MKPVRMPSPVVMQLQAGKAFGARTVMMSSTWGPVELHSWGRNNDDVVYGIAFGHEQIL